MSQTSTSRPTAAHDDISTTAMHKGSSTIVSSASPAFSHSLNVTAHRPTQGATSTQSQQSQAYSSAAESTSNRTATVPAVTNPASRNLPTIVTLEHTSSVAASSLTATGATTQQAISSTTFDATSASANGPHATIASSSHQSGPSSAGATPTHPPSAYNLDSNQMLIIFLAVGLGSAVLFSLLLVLWCWRRQRQASTTLYHLVPLSEPNKAATADDVLDVHEHKAWHPVVQQRDLPHAAMLELITQGQLHRKHSLRGSELTLANQAELLTTACRYSQCEELNHLLQTLSDAKLACEQLDDTRGYAPAHWACATNDVHCITAVVENVPEALVVPTRDGENVYQVCIRFGSLNVLEALVGCDVDAVFLMLFTKDQDGDSLLELAERAGYDDVLVYLQRLFGNLVEPEENLAKAATRTARSHDDVSWVRNAVTRHDWACNDSAQNAKLSKPRPLCRS
eukprot:TRINITY_DN11167_c0_g1_i5.p1 TRINITY_DN11167_c0_g1~~TRINITY_DN11167_c0_g1_i5.p1  ORF type:complete len:454 (+),score=58.93 TRINITY_DN11167_c0_g1_i5:758-2119(+)